jgi:hypothetical protein
MTPFNWKPMATLPPEFKDGREVIVGFDVATVWITRSAWWRKPEDNPAEFDADDEGWWSARHSVTSERLDEYMTPTHWLCETPDPMSLPIKVVKEALIAALKESPTEEGGATPCHVEEFRFGTRIDGMIDLYDAAQILCKRLGIVST